MGIGEASRELDQRARKFAEENGCTYEHGLKVVLGDDPELAARYQRGDEDINDAIQSEGDALHQEVIAYQARHNVGNYSTALRGVMHEARERHEEIGPEYDRRVVAYAEHFKVPEDRAASMVQNSDPEMRAYAESDDWRASGVTATHRLGILLSGARRPEGGVDVPEALRISRGHVDIVQQASGERLTALVHQLWDNNATPQPERNFGTGMADVGRRYPALLASWNSGMLNEESLKTILWPWFSRETS